MTREEIIQNSHSAEVQRLVKSLPNDMELGKAIRQATNKVTEKIGRLQSEGTKNKKG